MRTFSAKPHESEREWFVVDATGMTLVRLASRIATIFLGKHTPICTPPVDCGHFVIVVNADKIHVTGRTLDQNMYYPHPG